MDSDYNSTMELIFEEGRAESMDSSGNNTIVALIFEKLSFAYKFLPANKTINQRRATHFAQLCNLLNEYYIVPDNHCPFYFDQVSCWSATAPGQTAVMQCVTWQFDRPNPGGVVELKCSEDGQWKKIVGKELVSMYRVCKLPVFDSLVEWSRLLAQFGYILSSFSLIIAVLLFIYLRRLKCGRNQIHFNLFISFILRSIISIIQFVHFGVIHTKNEADDLNIVCKMITTLWNYSILSSYFWIFVEGLYLHNLIYFSVFKETSVLPYAVFGWGTPVIICLFWMIMRIINTKSNCWLTMDFHLILKLPLVAITLLEIFIALNIARQLYYKLRNAVQHAEKEKYRKLARSTLYLITGTGVNFFFFDIVVVFFDLFSSSSKAAHSIYIIINSFWGFFVSILYCFISEEIKKEWLVRRNHRKFHISLQKELRNAHVECNHRSKFFGEKYRFKSCAKCSSRRRESKSLLSSGATTQISTVTNSRHNTLSNIKQPIPMQTFHLTLCKEESGEASGL